MRQIFVNLKRFDVPRSMGGICPDESPAKWAKDVIDSAITAGLGTLDGIEVTFFFSEALVETAMERLMSYASKDRLTLKLGCQGVYRADVAKGGNFGAFTTNLPAAAAKALGCEWALIAHSEERRDKQSFLEMYDPDITSDPSKAEKAFAAADSAIGLEVKAALSRDMDVLLCVGETAEERGDGTFDEQKPRIRKVLERQLMGALGGAKEMLSGRKLWIGYEPVWAIGPGKTPPGADYIAYVSKEIKDILFGMLGMDVGVVYGGGLKKENAASISAIPTIGGGLIALTKFTQPVAFEPAGLKEIIDEYMK